MTVRHGRCRRARSAGGAAVLAVTVAVAGCGGGSGGEPSATAYYGSIDRFCAKVAAAAQQVGRDTAVVRRDRTADRARVVRVVSGSLVRFADSTEQALNDLERTGVPKAFRTYQDATATGFRRFVATLRTTAVAARRDGAAALATLGPKLNAVKLPDPPAAITANAKTCARFTPAA